MAGMHRRSFLKGGLVLGATATMGGFTMAESAVAAPYLPYSADSFFRSRVEQAPTDATRTSQFRSFMKSHPDQRGVAWPKVNGIGSNLWGTAFAVGAATDPVWRLTGSARLPASCADLKTTGFRAPAWFGEMFSGTNDSPFVVCDVAFGQSVWAANAAKGPGYTISFSAAGRFRHNTNGLDRRNPRSNGPQNERSRGAIPDAMAITRERVDYGIANGTGLGHVLHMFLVETRTADGFCNPMVGEEGGKYGFGAEGERIRISPTVDLPSRGLTGAALVVARTLQQHGCYFGDNSGSKTALKAQQDSASRKNWVGTNLTQDCLKAKISWDDFEVVQRGWQ